MDEDEEVEEAVDEDDMLVDDTRALDCVLDELLELVDIEELTRTVVELCCSLVEVFVDEELSTRYPATAATTMTTTTAAAIVVLIAFLPR